jgi:hypothetical protein
MIVCSRIKPRETKLATLLSSKKTLGVCGHLDHIPACRLMRYFVDLEDDIAKLEAIAEPSASEHTRLTELKSELEKINKKKEEYVEEHPEQRKLVFKARRRENKDDEEEKPVEQKRNLFKKNGLPRHPERSIYFDPVMNPFGVAPPGMPYMERGELFIYVLCAGLMLYCRFTLQLEDQMRFGATRN